MTQHTASQLKTTKPASMRPFFIIWGGQACSLIGSTLVQFALIWHLTTTTDSATVLTIASLVGLLPQILLLPLVGVWVDRWNRRLIMIAADGVIALAIVLLAVCFTFNWVSIGLIYFVMFIRSLGSAFHWSAMQATTPLLVSEQHLTRVASLNQGLHGVVSIVIPALAAVLLEWLPMQDILFIDVATASIAIVPLLFVHIPNPVKDAIIVQAQENKSSMLDDLRAGFAFVWNWTGLRLLVSLSVVMNLFFAPANALFPILVTKTFGGDAFELAWVHSSVGLGSVLGSLLLAAWGGFQNRMLTSILGIFLQGLAILIVGVTPDTAFLLMMITMGVIGLANPISNSPFFAALQASVPNEIQGRVLTLVSTGLQATTPIGLLIAGPLADSLGVQIIYILCGIVMLMISIIFFITPSILHFENAKQTNNGYAQSFNSFKARSPG